MRGRRVPNQAADQVLEMGVQTILGRPLTRSERADVDKYLTLLMNWNKIHRLVGSSSPDWLVLNIILDSLLFLRVLPAHVVDVADLGSGAGVPGIPLALVRRDLHMTLIESRRRRASFLATVVRELGLTHVRVVDQRAEDAQGLAETFDAVVSRCAGERTGVIRIGLALLRPGGTLAVAGSPKAEVIESEASLVTVPGIAGSTRRFALYPKRGPS